MSKTLFDNSDGSDEEIAFKTNENYAQHFKKTRKRELLQKYKDRGLDVSESELDTDSETSEEEEVDPKFDEQFFKTLASLKRQDPAIYNKEKRFFDTENNEKPKRAKEKPINIRDYERDFLLKTKGEYSEDENEDVKRSSSPTVAEETEQIKHEFKKVLQTDNDDNDEEESEAFGGIFKKREKTKEQQDAEETDYIKWLAGQTEHVKSELKQELEPLKKYWESQRLSNEERFLRNYILNKGYSNSKESEIPTYEEIVGEERVELSEDEQELEKQELFEHKYNFRFEEPDTEFIKRYPRTIENTVRRTDNTRKEKRQKLKERKEAEKAQKMKELEMLKEMKRAEIEEKLRKIKAVTGNDQLGIRDEELEEDFDPEAHDRRMQELFNDEYYAVDEGEEKPDCPSDIEELKLDEDWDEYDPNVEEKEDEAPHCEDDDFNMDCEYDPEAAKKNLQQELIENTRRRKGRRGKSKFMEVIRAEKPRFNPEDEKTYAEYIDEYYKLDCEDFIGDLPCRFKYVETTPNDFGLTIEEILLAKNKELNRWASLKKAIQIRPEAIEKKEARMYRLKAKNEELKRKIFKSIYGDGTDSENSDQEENEVETKKKVENSKKEEEEAEAASTSASAVQQEAKKKKKKRKRKATATAITSESTESKKMKMEAGKNNPFKNANKKQQKSNNGSTQISDERFRAYGINPRKFHNKQKYAGMIRQC